VTQQNLNSLPVVLVDDESSVLLSAKMILRSAGITNVQAIQDSREVMPALTEEEPAAVVLDLFMPYFSGSELLPQIVKRFPDVPVIVMTAAQEVETAVACMKDGAFDYLVKPVEESRFVSSVKRALEVRTLRQQIGSLKRYLMTDDLEHQEAFASIITHREYRGTPGHVDGSVAFVLGTGYLVDTVAGTTGYLPKWTDANTLANSRPLPLLVIIASTMNVPPSSARCSCAVLPTFFHQRSQAFAFAGEVSRAVVMIVVGDQVAQEGRRLRRGQQAVVVQHVQRRGPGLVGVQHDGRAGEAVHRRMDAPGRHQADKDLRAQTTASASVCEESLARAYP